jgi:hypothetical protein
VVESAEIELSPSRGRGDLELELTRGGSLEGRLLLDPSRVPGPNYVTLSRGTCSDRSTQVGATGEFHLDNLTPGTWRIRRTDRDCTYALDVRRDGVPDPYIREVTIVDGRTTRFDLDLRAFANCSLDGRVSISGFDLRTWNATLATDKGWETRSPVSADGSFTFVVDGEGTRHIELASAATDSRSDSIEARVELKFGLSSWRLDVPLGSVESDRAPERALRFVWKSADGTQWTIDAVVEAGQPFAIDRMPAGRIDVRNRSSEPLGTVDVRAGERARIVWR